MFVPDPRWEEPSLLIPGKKPTGPVVIDLGSKLADRLALCVIFQPNSDLRDLARGSALSVSGAPAYAGDRYVFDGTDDAAQVALDLSDTDAITIMSGFDWPAFANNDDMAMEFTANAGSNSGAFFIDPNSSGGKFEILKRAPSTASLQDAQFTRPSTGYHNYIFELSNFNTTSGIAVWVDGAEQSLTYPLNATHDGNFANSTLNIASRNATTLFGNVKYSYLIIFKGAIGGLLVSSGAYKNPYQFLCPA